MLRWRPVVRLWWQTGRFCSSTACPPSSSLQISSEKTLTSCSGAADSNFVEMVVPDEEHGSRLDRFIKRRAPGFPPGLIQRLIRQRKIIVGSSPANRNAYPVSARDVVLVPGDLKLGLSRGKKKPPPDDVSLKEAEIIKRWVIHREARCVVLNKPPGIATQGGTGMGDRHIEALLPGIGAGRYWLVHRLDKEVSGALVVARDLRAAGILADHFKNRRVVKTYWALVHGTPSEKSGIIETDVAGKYASTAYRVVQSFDNNVSWLELVPSTGRKHQLRIHCAETLQTPIVGDSKYYKNNTQTIPWELGAPSEASRDDNFILLHARCIDFPKLTKVHERKGHSTDTTGTDAGRVRVVAPLPQKLRGIWSTQGVEAR